MHLKAFQYGTTSKGNHLLFYQRELRVCCENELQFFPTYMLMKSFSEANIHDYIKNCQLLL